MKQNMLNSLKNKSVMNKIFSILNSAWEVIDIGKESEPNEYKGKSLFAYYDNENTLEASIANVWTFIIEPSSHTNITHPQISEFTEENKSWLLDLSRPMTQESTPISNISPQSA